MLSSHVCYISLVDPVLRCKAFWETEPTQFVRKYHRQTKKNKNYMSGITKTVPHISVAETSYEIEELSAKIPKYLKVCVFSVSGA